MRPPILAVLPALLRRRHERSKSEVDTGGLAAAQDDLSVSGGGERLKGRPVRSSLGENKYTGRISRVYTITSRENIERERHSCLLLLYRTSMLLVPYVCSLRGVGAFAQRSWVRICTCGVPSACPESTAVRVLLHVVVFAIVMIYKGAPLTAHRSHRDHDGTVKE